MFRAKVLHRVGCGLALVAAVAACSSDPGSGRTILLVSIDSVRADYLTFMDANTAPHMSELAKRGTIFTQASAPSSWTLPGHVTMFTGAPPSLHGVEWDDVAMDRAHGTLPEMLHDAGWTTAGWWTGWFLADEYGFARGFDLYENSMTVGNEAERAFHEAVAQGDVERSRALSRKRGHQGHQDISSPNVLRDVQQALDVYDADEDVFLFTHLFDAHYDYIPSPPFDTKFDPDYTGTMTGDDFYKNRAIFDGKKDPKRRISDRDLKHIEALYRGEIAFIDEYIGRMLDALDDAGRLENALIVITADHGEEFFEHGNRGHRQGLYREAVDVPLLVVKPGGSGRESGLLVDLTDVMPTILDFAKVEPPPTCIGQSLMPTVNGIEQSGSPQLAGLVHYRGPDQKFIILDSYRTGDQKIIRTMTVDRDRNLRIEDVEMFDLKADPQELDASHDREAIARSPEWAAFMARLEEIEAVYTAAGPSPRADRATRVRELFSDDLAALGYAEVQDGVKLGGLGLPWPPGPRPSPPLE